MSAPLVRASLWTDKKCDSGTMVREYLELVSCETTEEILNLLVSRTLSFAVPQDWAGAADLIAGRVIRLEFDTVGTLWDEYRISEVQDGSGGDALVQVLAQGIESDLGNRNLLVVSTVNTVAALNTVGPGLTPTQQLTNYVDANLPSSWAVGTVTPTDLIDVTYSADTPLSAALKIAAAANLKSGAVYEISVRRNGTTGYYIDLTAYGASASVADFRLGKNLLATNRTVQTAAQTTRAYVTDGDGSGIARPYYSISAISASTYIEVTDMIGGPGPAQEDDQFNAGYYWIEAKNGTSHAITDSSKISAQTTRFNIASTTGMATGELGYIAANSGGGDLSYLDSPSLQTTYGIRIGVLPGGSRITNPLLNPDLRDWTGSYPASWIAIGGMVAPTKETGAGLWREGGVSSKMTGGSDAGMEQTLSFYCPQYWTVAYLGFIWVPTSSGTSLSGLKFYNPNTGAAGTLRNIQPGPEYRTLTESFIVSTAGTKTLGVQALHTASQPTWYFDAALIALIPPGVTVPTKFLRGSGAALNLAMANAHFTSHGAPITTYQIKGIDLYRLDSTGIGQFEQLSLGATVKDTDTALGVTITQRAVRLVTNQLLLHDADVTLSTVPEQLTQIILAGTA